jgi:hypothetical protein
MSVSYCRPCPARRVAVCGILDWSLCSHSRQMSIPSHGPAIEPSGISNQDPLPAIFMWRRGRD